MSVIRMPVTNIMVVTPMGAPEVTEDHWLHRPRLEDRQGEIFCIKPKPFLAIVVEFWPKISII